MNPLCTHSIYIAFTTFFFLLSSYVLLKFFWYPSFQSLGMILIWKVTATRVWTFCKEMQLSARDMFFKEDKKKQEEGNSKLPSVLQSELKSRFSVIATSQQSVHNLSSSLSCRALIEKVNKKYRYFSVLFELPSLTACLSHQSNPTISFTMS